MGDKREYGRISAGSELSSVGSAATELNSQIPGLCILRGQRLILHSAH